MTGLNSGLEPAARRNTDESMLAMSACPAAKAVRVASPPSTATILTVRFLLAKKPCELATYASYQGMGAGLGRISVSSVGAIGAVVAVSSATLAVVVVVRTTTRSDQHRQEHQGKY